MEAVDGRYVNGVKKSDWCLSTAACRPKIRGAFPEVYRPRAEQGSFLPASFVLPVSSITPVMRELVKSVSWWVSVVLVRTYALSV